MNPNNNPIICDLETVITAHITIIDRDVEMSENFDHADYTEFVKSHVKEYFKNHSKDGKALDDEHFKVQLFVHEKGNGGDRE